MMDEENAEYLPLDLAQAQEIINWSMTMGAVVVMLEQAFLALSREDVSEEDLAEGLEHVRATIQTTIQTMPETLFACSIRNAHWAYNRAEQEHQALDAFSDFLEGVTPEDFDDPGNSTSG
jgi:hypothetical protein